MNLSGKFNPPTVSRNLIERKELNKKISGACLEGHVFITAHAGYGKTVSALEWLKSEKREFSWLNIDKLDNSPLTFCENIIEAQFGQEGKEAVRDLFVSKEFIKNPLECLLGAKKLIERKKKPLLILDDFHLITNERILEYLSLYIRRMPPEWRVFIISREQPPESFIEMMLKGEFKVIGYKDLIFNSEETDFFFKNKGYALPEDALRRIERVTEGWAAAINIIGQLTKEEICTPEIEKTDMKWVDQYFRERIINGYQHFIKLFLIKTSFMESLNPAVCNLTLGIENSRAILSGISESNHFLHRLKNNEYKLHYLFKSFLTKEFEKFDRVSKNELYSKYADILIKSGNTRVGVDFYLKAGEYDTAWRAAYMCEFGVEDYAASIARYLPKAAENDLLLMLKLAWAYYILGDVKSMERWLNLFDEKIQEQPNTLNNNSELKFFYIFVKSLYPKKSPWEIVKYFKSAEKPSGRLPLITLTQNMPSFFRGGMDFSPILPEIGAYVKDLRPAAKSLLGFSYDILEDIILAEAAYEKNDVGLAHEIIIRAVEKCSKGCSSEIFFTVLCQLCIIQYALNQKSKCNETILKIKDMINLEKADYLKQNFKAFTVRLNIRDGGRRAAEGWLAGRAEDNRTLAFNGLYQHFATAASYIATECYTEAAAFLCRLECLCMEYGRIIDLTEVYILKALVYKRTNEIPMCFKAIAEALETGYEYGFIRVFLDNGVLEVLEALNEKSPDYPKYNKRYVRKLIYLIKTQRLSPSDVANGLKNIRLSARQQSMLLYLSQDMTYDEISKKTGLKITTIRTHISNLYRKLDATHKKEALEKARELGFIE